MKLPENSLDRLKQSDRIEYLLRLDRLEKQQKNYMSYFTSELMTFVLLSFLALNSVLLMKPYLTGIEWSNLFTALFLICNIWIKVLIIILIVASALAVLQAWKFVKDKKQLMLKFFKFEINPVNSK